MDEIVARPFAPTSVIMGVMRPVGVATATEMSALLYLAHDQVENAGRLAMWGLELTA